MQDRCESEQERLIEGGRQYGDSVVGGAEQSRPRGRRAFVTLAVGMLLLLLPDGELPQEWLYDSRWPYIGSWIVDDRSGKQLARQRELQRLEHSDYIAAGVRRSWQQQAERALQHAQKLDLPYRESLVLDPVTPHVSVFEFELGSPAALRLQTTHAESAQGGLLVEVLQRRLQSWTVLASYGPEPLDERWTVPVNGLYRVRVQALIGSVGRLALALEERPVMDFPVLTERDDSVRSQFGDPRDGGRRAHHGIDIFAPRGTPVVAAADGIVSRTGISPRGGQHVWQRAEAPDGQSFASLYYAHLDRIDVQAGERVRRGDVLGTVGNTGNAISTPPHLHFGLYRRFLGPEDPLPLVGSRRFDDIELQPGHPWPRWMWVETLALNLRKGPSTQAEIVGRLRQGAMVQIEGQSGAWLRVRTGETGAENRSGFVSASLLASTVPAIETIQLSQDTPLLLTPEDDAPSLVELKAGEAIQVHGEFGGFRRVASSTGIWGWQKIAAYSSVEDSVSASPAE